MNLVPHKTGIAERNFEFRDLHESLQFVSKVGDLAVEFSFLPDIEIDFNKVKVVLRSPTPNSRVESFFSKVEHLLLS